MLFCVVLCSILCYLMIWYDILCVGNQTNIYFSYTSRGHDYGCPTGHQLVLADAAVAFAHVLQAGDPFIGTFAWQDVSTGLHCVKLIIGPNIQWSCSNRVQPSPHNWPKNSKVGMPWSVWSVMSNWWIFNSEPFIGLSSPSQNGKWTGFDNRMPQNSSGLKPVAKVQFPPPMFELHNGWVFCRHEWSSKSCVFIYRVCIAV